MKNAVMEIVQQHFRPEFINRVDDIVVFHPLGAEQIRAIVEIQLQYLRRRLLERNMELELDDKARDLIGEAGFDPVYGARPLKRAIQQQIENPLAQRILRNEFGPGDRVRISVRGSELVFEKQREIARRRAPEARPAHRGPGAVSSRQEGCLQQALVAARSVAALAHSGRSDSAHIVDVPDFPRPGILFRDITPLLREHFAATLDALEGLFSEHEWRDTEALAGVESRGFVLAAGLAARRGKGFVPIRKQGKLPPPVVSAGYALEYGSGVLEMQRGGGRVLLIDDVLATGGTLQASAELCATAGYQVQGLAVLIDLRLVGRFCLARAGAARGDPL